MIRGQRLTADIVRKKQADALLRMLPMLRTQIAAGEVKCLTCKRRGARSQFLEVVDRWTERHKGWRCKNRSNCICRFMTDLPDDVRWTEAQSANYIKMNAYLMLTQEADLESLSPRSTARAETNYQLCVRELRRRGFTQEQIEQ